MWLKSQYLNGHVLGRQVEMRWDTRTVHLLSQQKMAQVQLSQLLLQGLEQFLLHCHRALLLLPLMCGFSPVLIQDKRLIVITPVPPFSHSFFLRLP